jgi:hypothetical protein
MLSSHLRHLTLALVGITAVATEFVLPRGDASQLSHRPPSAHFADAVARSTRAAESGDPMDQPPAWVETSAIQYVTPWIDDFRAATCSGGANGGTDPTGNDCSAPNVIAER